MTNPSKMPDSNPTNMEVKYEELRALAEAASNVDDTGGTWSYVCWGEKENSAGVLAAVPYSDPEKVASGEIDNDPDKFHSEVIAACDCPQSGITRAAFIAAANPAVVLELLDTIKRLEGALVDAGASLAAAISLLENTPKAKKAAASDKMFGIMLNDYRKSLARARTAMESERGK